MEGLMPNWFEDIIQHDVRGGNECTLRISGVVGKVRRLDTLSEPQGRKNMQILPIDHSLEPALKAR